MSRGVLLLSEDNLAKARLITELFELAVFAATTIVAAHLDRPSWLD
jgi:hypothetical protein